MKKSICFLRGIKIRIKLFFKSPRLYFSVPIITGHPLDEKKLKPGLPHFTCEYCGTEIKNWMR